MLTDISIEHVYKGKKSAVPLTFTMHPFRNSQGEFADLFEIIHTRKQGSKPVKRSAHVTEPELAELFARGLLEEHEIRLRLRPAGGGYPDAPPGKKVPRHCVRPGSGFDRAIRIVDLTQPISSSLKAKLAPFGLVP